MKLPHERQSFEEEVESLQELINSGLAWRLEGSLGRLAREFINAGYCMLGEKGHQDYWGNYVPSRHEVKAGTKGSKEYCDKLRKERED